MRVWLGAVCCVAAMTGSLAKAAAPVDPQHAALAALAGHWSVTQTLWSTPGAPPAIDQGEADFAMVLDGRHLRQELHIAAKDKPFEGLGYIGYDTSAKTYFSTWMDVNFTGFIIAKGDYDAAARRYVFKGEVPNAAHPETPISLREVMTVRDADHFTYDYYETQNGKEAQAVKLDYTRAH